MGASGFRLWSAESKTGDLARGFGAVVALGLLLVGVPVALAALAGWPLPHGVPTWSELTSALGDSYIPDSFLVKALALGCWVIWFELAAAMVVESVAVARGRTAPRLPLGGPMQRMVGRLVASVVLLLVLVASRPDATPLRPLAPAPAAAPVLQHAVMEETEPAIAPAQAQAPVDLTYTVQRRDTLWGIAEVHLEDPYRWNEIWVLNKDLPQPGGDRLRDPGHIHPGWVLHMPADAVGLAATVPAPPAPAPEPAPRPEPQPVSTTDTGVETSAMEVMVALAPDGGPALAPPGASAAAAAPGTAAARASAPAPDEPSAPAPVSEAEIMVAVPDDGGGAPQEPLVASGRTNHDILPEASRAGIRTQAKEQRSAWTEAIRRLRGQ